MASSHQFADRAAGYFEYAVSDGTHSHVQRIHTSIATVVNPAVHAVPSDSNSLIIPEADVNDVARNTLFFLSIFTPNTYTLRPVDFQPVTGGVPAGPKIPLTPFSLTGLDGGSPLPEAQVSLTWRDTEGAPARLTIFGGGTLWAPGARGNLVADYSGSSFNILVAYFSGLARAGSNPIPAANTKVVSHNGRPFSIPLHQVSTLNNRLRRSYKVR